MTHRSCAPYWSAAALAVGLLASACVALPAPPASTLGADVAALHANDLRGPRDAPTPPDASMGDAPADLAPGVDTPSTADLADAPTLSDTVAPPDAPLPRPDATPEDLGWVATPDLVVRPDVFLTVRDVADVDDTADVDDAADGEDAAPDALPADADRDAAPPNDAHDAISPPWCLGDDDCRALDDDDLCNGQLRCATDIGVCVPDLATVVVCPAAPCARAQCVPSTGLCEPFPVEDGTPCAPTDGLPPGCWTAPRCVAGDCTFAPLGCGALGDECHVGRCDERSGTCRVDPLEDGAECEAATACRDAAVCVGGQCAPGDDVVCDDAVACTEDRCEVDAGGCVFAPLDRLCGDADRCNGEERCDPLVGCVPGAAVECPPSEDPCLANACTPDNGRCREEPANEGAACQTDDPEAPPGACRNGKCK